MGIRWWWFVGYMQSLLLPPTVNRSQPSHLTNIPQSQSSATVAFSLSQSDAQKSVILEYKYIVRVQWTKEVSCTENALWTHAANSKTSHEVKRHKKNSIKYIYFATGTNMYPIQLNITHCFFFSIWKSRDQMFLSQIWSWYMWKPAECIYT